VAGLGFKDFQVGEVLTSSDVDGYLMQQTVMRFADSAARGSALGTAVGTSVALAEGMVAYLDDAGRTEFYDGTAWKVVSPLVQVQQAYATADQTVTSTSFVDVTGATLTVTPATASSKFLLLFTNYGEHVGNITPEFRFDRGGTAIGEAWSFTNSNTFRSVTAASYLDSPATTSSTTYKVEVRVSAGSFSSRTSALTLFEVTS